MNLETAVPSLVVV